MALSSSARVYAVIFAAYCNADSTLGQQKHPLSPLLAYWAVNSPTMVMLLELRLESSSPCLKCVDIGRVAFCASIAILLAHDLIVQGSTQHGKDCFQRQGTAL